MDVLSLRPNYTMCPKSIICHAKMKEIYSKKYVKNEDKRESIPDILLDCENVNEMLNDKGSEEWERYSLDSMVPNVFKPVTIIDSIDIEEFYIQLYQELGLDEDELYSEEDNGLWRIC